MSEILKAAAAHRQALLNREAAAAGRMVRAYGEAWQHIQRQLALLQKEIAAAKKAGKVVDRAWLEREGRLLELRRQTLAEIAKFAVDAEETIRVEQAAAIAAAQEAAKIEAAASFVPQPALPLFEAQKAGVMARWVQVPTAAMEDLVGFLGDGSPLRSLLDKLPALAAEDVEKQLLLGLATGRNPRATARAIRSDLGGKLGRSLTIARTETLRSYRESSRRAYEANQDVVDKWRWSAALDKNTCPACIAMHGTEHPVTETLKAHPNCRCAMVPVTKSWAEILGDNSLPDTRPKTEKGADWFARQDPEIQAEILGPSAYQAYAAGEITLLDLRGHRHSKKWGGMFYARSLKAAKEASARRGR